LVDSKEDIKQTLHIVPNTFQNYLNIYQPSKARSPPSLLPPTSPTRLDSLRGNPSGVTSGAEQSAKLCVQYLAPIIKNRQYNFPPIGEN